MMDPESEEYKKIKRQFNAGFLTADDLKKEINKMYIKQDLSIKEEFLRSYNPNYQVGLKPLENQQRYKFEKSPEKVLRFVDNLIYFK